MYSVCCMFLIVGESVTPMLDEVAAVTFDPRTTLLESGSSAAYDAPSLPEEETRLIATLFEEKMDTGGVSNVVFPVSDHTYDRMDEEVRDDVKTPVTQLEKVTSLSVVQCRSEVCICKCMYRPCVNLLMFCGYICISFSHTLYSSE